MASIPDLMNLLCLDSHASLSPFGGLHRTVLVTKDYTNVGDYVFKHFIQHFSRKEPKTPTLLIMLSQDWNNYCASAAKCGYNIRSTENGGNVETLNLMKALLDSEIRSLDLDLCDLIAKTFNDFIDKHSHNSELRIGGHESSSEHIMPLIVMIDDLSLLLSLGYSQERIYRLFLTIDGSLRERSKKLHPKNLSYFIVQSSCPVSRAKQLEEQSKQNSLGYLVANLENLCDLSIVLKPLETGYSTRVDGTIKIVDNRMPAQLGSRPSLTPTLFPNSFSDIGVKKAFFFKVGDRRVRLTSSALIY